MPKPLYERALVYINDHFSFYDTANLDDFKIDNLLRIAKSLIRQKGVDAIILDPFNYIEHDNQNDIMNEKIGRMLVKMKKFALTNKVMVLLVAHPKKMLKNKNSNQYEIPRLYDISGSHHFFNVTDNGFATTMREADTIRIEVPEAPRPRERLITRPPQIPRISKGEISKRPTKPSNNALPSNNSKRSGNDKKRIKGCRRTMNGN